MKKLMLFLFVAFAMTTTIHAQSTAAQQSKSEKCAEIRDEIKGIDKEIKSLSDALKRATSSQEKARINQDLTRLKQDRKNWVKKLTDTKC